MYFCVFLCISVSISVIGIGNKCGPLSLIAVLLQIIHFAGRLEMVCLFPVFLLTHLPLVLSEARVGADQLGDVLAGEAGGEAAGHLD